MRFKGINDRLKIANSRVVNRILCSLKTNGFSLLMFIDVSCPRTNHINMTGK